ncbi:MAG: hypothetical protein GEU98_05650 [Pseudonocardiaceae bacterium]|nr:hypothetical protein [Pseudonocardiaceae bacterium]
MDALWYALSVGWLLMCVLVLVLAVVFAVRHARTRNVKIHRLSRLAHARGWQYRFEDLVVLLRYRGTPFDRGADRAAQHVITGTHRGRPFCCFEYSFNRVQVSRTGTRSNHFRIYAVRTPTWRPALQVTREDLGTQLVDSVTGHDLQLESTAFNQTFRVLTENDRFAYDVLNPRMMEWMLRDPRALNVPFRFERDELVAWERGTFEGHMVESGVDYLCDILDRVPDFVWK